MRDVDFPSETIVSAHVPTSAAGGGAQVKLCIAGQCTTTAIAGSVARVLDYGDGWTRIQETDMTGPFVDGAVYEIAIIDGSGATALDVTRPAKFDSEPIVQRNVMSTADLELYPEQRVEHRMRQPDLRGGHPDPGLDLRRTIRRRRSTSRCAAAASARIGQLGRLRRFRRPGGLGSKVTCYSTAPRAR